jgi:hypothetical protein
LNIVLIAYRPKSSLWSMSFWCLTANVLLAKTD